MRESEAGRRRSVGEALGDLLVAPLVELELFGDEGVDRRFPPFGDEREGRVDEAEPRSVVLHPGVVRDQIDPAEIVEDEVFALPIGADRRFADALGVRHTAWQERQRSACLDRRLGEEAEDLGDVGAGEEEGRRGDVLVPGFLATLPVRVGAVARERLLDRRADHVVPVRLE